MDSGLTAFLVVCPLVFLGGFVDSIAGGGGLITLPAYILAGLPVHGALATNKLSSTPGAIVSVLRFWRNGFIDVSLILPSVAAALIGAALGAGLVMRVSEVYLQYLLLLILPLSAFVVLGRRTLTDERAWTISRRRSCAFAALISLAVGAYDGFYGPGTGTFLILLFSAIARMDVRNAVGSAKAVNFASNIAAFATFLFGGGMNVPLGMTAAVFGMAGHWVGSGLAIRKGTRIVRPLVLAVIALLFAKVAFG